MNAPRILLFTGDGKGKTTAALGMALRAAGHGMRVCIAQFIKRDDSVGEVAAVRDMANIRLLQTGLGFVPERSSPKCADHRRAAEDGLRQAAQAMDSGEFQMLVLDEVCAAIAKGLLEEAAVIELAGRAKPGMIVVLTGREASDKLIALADTATEMRCIKHALQTGRAAEEGVER